MAYASTHYANEHAGTGRYCVVFIVRETQAKLMRSFDSPFYARQFVNKLRHSKRCILVSYPIFD